MSIKGIPVYIFHDEVVLNRKRCEETALNEAHNSGLALTHSELKELMREAFEAAKEQFRPIEILDGFEVGSLDLEDTYPDFETYYKQRGEG